jgi:hypothetical protein
MSMLSAAAARRAGKILGGDEGRAMIAKANERLGAQEVVDPGRFSRALAV